MTALTGDFGLIAACFFAGLTTVFVLGCAGARNVRALLLVRFLHWSPLYTPFWARHLVAEIGPGVASVRSLPPAESSRLK